MKIEQRDGIMEVFMGDAHRCWFWSLFCFWFCLFISLLSTSSLSFHVLIFLLSFTVRLYQQQLVWILELVLEPAVGWQLVAEKKQNVENVSYICLQSLPKGTNKEQEHSMTLRSIFLFSLGFLETFVEVLWQNILSKLTITFGFTHHFDETFKIPLPLFG